MVRVPVITIQCLGACQVDICMRKLLETQRQQHRTNVIAASCETSPKPPTGLTAVGSPLCKTGDTGNGWLLVGTTTTCPDMLQHPPAPRTFNRHAVNPNLVHVLRAPSERALRLSDVHGSCQITTSKPAARPCAVAPFSPADGAPTKRSIVRQIFWYA